ncbi:MAG TPA: glycoside hydrolase N-terminal domain-containing protein, partial [Bacteroidales bacterium]|nr:glycoside hydrolase N-terminal domain-containing protein [Bacteroidales bacterium]
MGDLFIDWADTAATVSDYQKWLDLESALVTSRFTRGGVTYKEEVFTDFVNDITWVRLTSSKIGALNFGLTLYRKTNATIEVKNQQIFMKGQLPSGADKGMRFA